MLLILACVSTATVCSCESTTDKAFLPLAGITLSISQPQRTELLDALERFARKENLNLRQGSFPKRRQSVNNMKLSIDAESFFYISNFNDPEQFMINAYSHDEERAWKPVWLRLKSYLAEVFGSNSIAER
jgi:hypothetical protein